jgi:hypothetical protein
MFSKSVRAGPGSVSSLQPGSILRNSIICLIKSSGKCSSHLQVLLHQLLHLRLIVIVWCISSRVDIVSWTTGFFMICDSMSGSAASVSAAAVPWGWWSTSPGCPDQIISTRHCVRY